MTNGLGTIPLAYGWPFPRLLPVLDETHTLEQFRESRMLAHTLGSLGKYRFKSLHTLALIRKTH